MMNAVTVSMLLVLFLGAVTSQEASGEYPPDEEYMQANGDPHPENCNNAYPNEEDDMMPNKVAACTNDTEGIPITLPGSCGESKSCRYIVYPCGRPFPQAQQQCRRIGGSLVSITNRCLNHKIQRLVRHMNRCISQVWIGLLRHGSCIHYHNINGSRSRYRNWACGQPMRGRNCATLNICSGKWTSVYCNQRMPFVCRV
ncbi:bone marrow proteoglycan-like [Ambystoma mexicanum]|uniref:bone marrow proteoglycan-like n=1 Tax=Ambystoma mexicanum TaxID=8296 RepID=UPI0037E8CDD0